MGKIYSNISSTEFKSGSGSPKTEYWQPLHNPEIPYSFLEISSLKSWWRISVSQDTHKDCMIRSAASGKMEKAGLLRSGGRGGVMGIIIHERTTEVKNYFIIFKALCGNDLGKSVARGVAEVKKKTQGWLGVVRSLLFRIHPSPFGGLLFPRGICPP